MIKLNRPPAPVELDEDTRKRLVDKYVNDNSSRVWDQPYIRKTLIKSSSSKCCYCERRIGPGFRDVHIDHFLPKKLYPREVVTWSNLLPSCGDCNRAKWEHDTGLKPIVNPYDDDPREYFYLKGCRYCPLDRDLDSKASTTIDVLNLNDLTKSCLVRYKVVAEILDQLCDLARDAKEHEGDLVTNTRTRNRIKRKMKGLLGFCVPSAEFSAFTSTALHSDENYAEVRTILLRVDAWDEELEKLDGLSRECVFRSSASNLIAWRTDGSCN